MKKGKKKRKKSERRKEERKKEWKKERRKERRVEEGKKSEKEWLWIKTVKRGGKGKILKEGEKME